MAHEASGSSTNDASAQVALAAKPILPACSAKASQVGYRRIAPISTTDMKYINRKIGAVFH
jgi:hypothetical protein